MIVAVLALTVIAPGYAEEVTMARNVYNSANDKLQGLTDTILSPIVKFDSKEFVCLARNIFFEAGNEPEEGKVAVALVTINRTQDGRFKPTVCGVVDQKLSRDIPKNQIIEKKQYFGFSTVTETQTIWSKISICQFSWRCMFVRDPKSQDERWLESQRIAREILADQESYTYYRLKYNDALYFHATGIRPSWAHQKKQVERVGGHIFYSDM
jgi:spore germination cell wall hydrolase CwlJ-like protein